MAAQLMGETRNRFDTCARPEAPARKYRDGCQTCTAYFDTVAVNAAAGTVTQRMRSFDGEESLHRLLWRRML